MSKKLWFKLLLGGSVLVAAVLWFMTIAMKDTVVGDTTFGQLDLVSWVILIISGGWAAAFILMGVFSKNVGVIKKFQVYFGIGFAVVFAITFIKLLVPQWPADDLIWPIIAIALILALVLGTIAVGGKKWDQGDNQNVGYKNYWQRKAEQEKEEKKNKDN